MIKVKSDKGAFWFTVHAANGAIICTSETYTRKANCKKAIYSLVEQLRDKQYKIIDTTIS